MGSKSEEDYVRALYYLRTKNGSAQSSQLASYLGVSKPGVSEMLGRLDKSGLVKKHFYGEATLTRKGLQLARKMTFRHRVLESFLSSSLKVPSGRVHAEACALEHAISDDTARRLYLLLGKPSSDPHGQPINSGKIR